MFNDTGTNPFEALFVVMALTIVAVIMIKALADQIRNWSDQRHERRMAEVRSLELARADEARERQCRILIDIIAAYQNVAGSQMAASELTALIAGIVRGNSLSNDPLLHAKLDEIIERLEALEQGNEVLQAKLDEIIERLEALEQGNEDDEADSSLDSAAPEQLLDIEIERGKTARVEAVLAHLRSTLTYPSPPELEKLILAAHGSKPGALRGTSPAGVRVDTAPVVPPADLASIGDRSIAGAASNDNVQQ